MAVETVNLEFEITNQDVISGTKNYVCSAKYIERVVKASVLNILFHRLPIPEKIFTTKEFDTVAYKAIHPDFYGTGIAQLFRKWMKGFLDSFRNKYLKEFILYFSEENQIVREVYKFKFEYGDKVSKEKACTDLTLPTIELLKSLLVLGDMPKLPNNIGMHVELFYMKGTPSGYQPPMFDTYDYESTLKSKMDKEKEKYNYEIEQFGRISTGFHYINISFKRKMNESQFLHDSDERHTRRKMTLSSSPRRKSRRLKSDISLSKEPQSFTSIDLTNNDSRNGISFDVDYDCVLGDEDIDAIAEVVSPRN